MTTTPTPGPPARNAPASADPRARGRARPGAGRRGGGGLPRRAGAVVLTGLLAAAGALAVAATAAVAADAVGAAPPLDGAVVQVAVDARPAYALPLDRPQRGLPDVLHGFEPPASRWSAGHRGVDLAAPPGEPVLSPASGVVTFAGPVAGRGVVTVLHEDGRRSSVEPVTATVRVGDRVAARARIGQLQRAPVGYEAHCAPASCLHWGVRETRDGAERYVDPLTLLDGAGPVVLLPLDR